MGNLMTPIFKFFYRTLSCGRNGLTPSTVAANLSRQKDNFHEQKQAH